MRHRLLFSFAGVALLLAGLIGGMLIGGRVSAQAAPKRAAVPADSTPLGRYCQAYEQTLVNELHVSEAALEQANLNALRQVLDQLVRDGQITATERDQIVPLLKQLGTQPCTHLTPDAIGGYLQSDPLLVQQLLAAHSALTAAVAGALHLTPDALSAALASKKTIADLAGQQRVALSAVNDAYLAAARAYLDQAVASGLLTRPQADAIDRLLAAAVARGAYPLAGPLGIAAPTR
jgi:hypothetical protein